TVEAHSPAEVKTNALAATEQVTLIALGLTVVAFLVGFLLPRKARKQEPAA
ncbi:MAG: hypothetical protein QOH50_5407, partial [Kribbellaceae bacterium]|nr:hypothetical protein [Kribbellaceae bacterium]